MSHATFLLPAHRTPTYTPTHISTYYASALSRSATHQASALRRSATHQSQRIAPLSRPTQSQHIASLGHTETSALCRDRVCLTHKVCICICIGHSPKAIPRNTRAERQHHFTVASPSKPSKPSPPNEPHVTTLIRPHRKGCNLIAPYYLLIYCPSCKQPTLTELHSFALHVATALPSHGM